MVAKATSFHDKNICVNQHHQNITNYDDLKVIVTLAKRNGWDLETLGFCLKHRQETEPTPLTRKQKLERDRLVKNVFMRFSSILTPPVPPDLERSILNRDKTTWLPWEHEVIDRITYWRDEIDKAKPQILSELNNILSRTSTAA